jgi:hypothetical protein
LQNHQNSISHEQLGRRFRHLDGGQFQRCFLARVAALAYIVMIESRRDIGARRTMAHPGASLQHHENGVQIRTSPRRL